MLPEELARPGFERNSRSISIDGRRLRVEVRTHRIDDSEAQRVGMLKLWRSAEIEIPYRELPIPGARLALLPDVARARLRLTLADSEILYEARVESLGESCNVAGRRVRCTEERVTLATTRAGSNETVELRRWLSAVVPGHLVREERGSSEPDGTVWPRSSRAALAFEAHRSGAAPR